MWRTHADRMPDEAAALSVLALADLHDAAEQAGAPWTLLLDEFGAVIKMAAQRGVAILQRGRSHGGQVIVITQSAADIDALTAAARAAREPDRQLRRRRRAPTNQPGVPRLAREANGHPLALADDQPDRRRTAHAHRARQRPTRARVPDLLGHVRLAQPRRSGDLHTDRRRPRQSPNPPRTTSPISNRHGSTRPATGTPARCRYTPKRACPTPARGGHRHRAVRRRRTRRQTSSTPTASDPMRVPRNPTRPQLLMTLRRQPADLGSGLVAALEHGWAAIRPASRAARCSPDYGRRIARPSSRLPAGALRSTALANKPGRRAGGDLHRRGRAWRAKPNPRSRRCSTKQPTRSLPRSRRAARAAVLRACVSRLCRPVSGIGVILAGRWVGRRLPGRRGRWRARAGRWLLRVRWQPRFAKPRMIFDASRGPLMTSTVASAGGQRAYAADPFLGAGTDELEASVLVGLRLLGGVEVQRVGSSSTDWRDRRHGSLSAGRESTSVCRSQLALSRPWSWPHVQRTRAPATAAAPSTASSCAPAQSSPRR